MARTRFQPHLVSQQLVGTFNSSIQTNRGSTLASMRPVFKRCAYLNCDPSKHLRQAVSCRAKPNVNTSHTDAISTIGLSSQLRAFSQPSHTPTSFPGFQGCAVLSAVTSDSLYVSTSVNHTQNLSIPTYALNCHTQSKQQPSAVLSDVTSLTSDGHPSDVPDYIARSVQQPSNTTRNLLGPSFTCQQTSVQSSSPNEQDLPLSCDTSSGPLDLCIESWLSDSKPVTQDGPHFGDMNNQCTDTARIDTSMLYFDLEMSWKSLTRS